MGPALREMFSEDSTNGLLVASVDQTLEVVARNGELWREELRKVIESLSGEVCIISGELLSDPTFCTKSINAFHLFLLPYFDEIRVFGYVRPPRQYKNSRFQQKLKHNLSRFDLNSVKLNYHSRFSKFDDVFGSSNVFLRKFDPATFPNQCAVTDFCQQIGIQLPGNSVIRKYNESLSRNACAILFAYRKFGPGYGVGLNAKKENTQLIRALELMGGSKFGLSQSIIDPEIALEREDIIWMERRIGASLEDEVLDGGFEATCEEDLLRISASSCAEFLSSFEKLNRVCVYPQFETESNPVDPMEVARLVQSCRLISRQILRQKKGFRLERTEKNPLRRKKTTLAIVAGRFAKFVRLKLTGFCRCQFFSF